MTIKSLRGSTALGLFLACILPTATFAEGTRTVDVGSQNLVDAIAELGAETGLQILGPDEILKGKKSAAVRGSMTPKQALIRMLDDDSLNVVALSDGTLVVSASSQMGFVSQNANEDPFDLGTLVLEALLPGTIEDTYVAPDTFSATRTDRPLKKVPQSVQALTRRSLEDTGVEDVADAYDHLAGVNRDNNTGGLFGDQVLVRGLTSDNILINGDRAGRPVSLDTANVERIEALRGPSATLFGPGEAGGTVNVITKQPLSEHFSEIGLSYNFGLGSDGGRQSIARADFDSGGPLNETGSVRYRFNLAAEGGDSFRRDIDSTLFFVSGVLEFDLSPNTIANLEVTHQQRKQPFDRGVFFVNGTLPLSRDFNLAEGQVGSYDQTYTSVATRLEHRFSDKLRGRVNLSYSFNDFDGTGAQVDSVVGTTATLENRADFGEYTYLIFQPELVYQFSTGSVNHTLLVGAEYSRSTADFTLNFGPGSAPVDVFNPVFPVATPPVGSPGTFTFDGDQTVESYAVYIQDEIDITDRFTVVAGARFEKIEADQLVTADVVGFGSFGGTNSLSDSDTTYRLGAVYAINDVLSVYGSYSQSFRFGGTQGVGLVDVNGDPIDPERGENYEVGFKFEGLGGNLLGTAAIFRTDKDNVIEAAPFPAIDRAVNLGKVRSQGFEFDVAGDLGAGLSLGATYTYLDVSVREATNGIPAGTTLRNVPTHSASLRAAYEFQNDWRLFGAIVHESSKFAATAAGAPELPDYTRVDLGASKRFRNGGELALFVENVFDEAYYPTAAGQNNVSVGAPMNATIAYNMRF